jgi:hypothetical protein
MYIFYIISIKNIRKNYFITLQNVLQFRNYCFNFYTNCLEKGIFNINKFITNITILLKI